MYHGWQIQKDATSVQQSVENALSVILRIPISIIGAGRTDTGVHARGQVANFKVDNLPVALGQLGRSLNGILREGIAIHRVSIVPEEFHSRYSALSRSYIYSVAKSKRSIDRNQYYIVMYPVDVEKMRLSSQKLLGKHDFRQFCVDAGKKSTLCTINSVEIIEDEETIKFNITANRFLHRMVRMIVGTLLAIGKGRISGDIIDKLLAGTTPGSKAYCAPAHGLCLTYVEYPEEFKSTRAARPSEHLESPSKSFLDEDSL
jgi:tRNA pseudouridine38-40 synthase